MVKAVASLLATDEAAGQSASRYSALACDLIRCGLEPLGYRYCKPLGRMLRKRAEFGLLLAFPVQTDNQTIRLSMRIDVYNQRLRAFRRTREPRSARSGRVAGGPLHLLAQSAPELSWSATSREDFHEIVIRALETIYQVALPYFDTLSNLDELIEDIEHEDIPGLDPKDALELLLCYERHDDADIFLRNWWQRYATATLESGTPDAADYGMAREQARQLALVMRLNGISH